jgi:hypothetical protein
MRATAIFLLLLPVACGTTRASSHFTGLGAGARDFLSRSAPQAAWTTRFDTAPADAASPRLPGTQILAFETDRALDEKETADLAERLEFEVVRSLYAGGARLVSRRGIPAQPGVRGVTWEYGTDDRRGFITFFGVRREGGYEVIFSVWEMGLWS